MKGPVLSDDMTPQRRELYLRVWDGFGDFHQITNRLHFLDNHFPPSKLNRALRWLISNNVTGARFANWFKFECKNSDLEMHRRLLAVVDNAELQPVVAGRNFKT